MSNVRPQREANYRMHAQAITSARWLLNELHDPFVMFSLQSVARSLSKAVTESQESFSTREGPFGVARKFWDVPMEMLHEEIGLLIGSAFVLGQATLTHSIAIISQLLQAPPRMPNRLALIFPKRSSSEDNY